MDRATITIRILIFLVLSSRGSVRIGFKDLLTCSGGYCRGGRDWQLKGQQNELYCIRGMNPIYVLKIQQKKGESKENDGYANDGYGNTPFIRHPHIRIVHLSS